MRLVYAVLLVAAAAVVGSVVLAWTLLDATALVRNGGAWGIAALAAWVVTLAALSHRYGRG